MSLVAKKPFFNKNRIDLTHGFKTNESIVSNPVRIVGEGIDSKICTRHEALEIAKELGLDLIEISVANEKNPAICKIMDFKKFIFDKKKRDKEIKNSNKSTLKEIKLGTNIQEHDLNFKIKNSIDFLKSGYKVKAYLFFKGREIVYKQKGEMVLYKFVQELEQYGRAEFLPRLEGKNMFVIVAPRK